MTFIGSFRNRLVVEKTRALIPRERYEQHQNSNDEERHLQRAKEWEGKNARMEQFHLASAEKYRALQQEIATGLNDIQTAADDVIAECDDALFEQAINKGYPKWLQTWKVLISVMGFLGREMAFLMGSLLKVNPRYLWWSSMATGCIGSILWFIYAGTESQMLISVLAGCATLMYGVVIYIVTDKDSRSRNVSFIFSLIFSILWVGGEVFWVNFAPNYPMHGISTRDNHAITSIGGKSNSLFVSSALLKDPTIKWYNSKGYASWNISLTYANIRGVLKIYSDRKLKVESLAKYGLSKNPDDYDYDLQLAANEKITAALNSGNEIDYTGLKKQIDSTANEVFYLTDTKITFKPKGEDSDTIQLAP